MKPVLHSISYAGLWRGQAALSLEDFLRRAAGLGFAGVEITAKRPHASPLDMPPERRDAVAALLRELRLDCVAMAAYTDFCNGAEGGLIPLTEMQLIYIEEICKLAAAWNCPLVRIFTGYERGDMAFWPQYDACVQGVRASCDIAAKYGVAVGIQNHHDIALDPPSLADFLNEVGRDNCKVMYDPWSPCARGLSPTADLDWVYDKMVYTTLADYQKVPRWHYQPAVVNYQQDLPLLRACGVGDGLIENRAFLDDLAARGYDGPVCYEMCSDLTGGGSLENLDRLAKQFLDYMKPWTK